jgi:Tol biopolymer transport system component
VFYSRVIAGNTVTLTARELGSGREREVIRLAGTQNTALVGLSPDGTKVYYRRSFPGSDSSVISGSPGATEYAFIERDLGSGADRELIRRSGLGHPQVSPDGRSIATASRDRSAKTHAVLLIPVTGGEARELMRVTEPDGINLAAWAPDSRSLVAVKNQAGQPPDLWWVPIDSRAIQKIDRIGSMAPFTLRVHPDGRQVAYVAPGATSGPTSDDVGVLENFRPPAGMTR